MSVLGLDIGTSGTKGVLCDGDGRILASSTLAHATSLPRPGWAEHDAEEIWWHDFASVTHQLLEAAATPAPLSGGGDAAGAGAYRSTVSSTVGIEAVCVSGIGPCALAADANGDPLRPAILYGIDTRATAEIDELTEAFGAVEILARCGSPLTTQAVGPKLLWLRRHEPHVWEQTRKLLMASSFIVHRLTGEYVLDHHSASQCTPLYDLEHNQWMGAWSDHIAPGLLLPRLAWPGEVVGTVTARAAARCGLPAGTPVLAGTIDAWAEGLSAGVSRVGDCLVMYGTSMFMVNIAPDARPHPRLWLTNGLEPGKRTMAAGMATFGALAEWFKRITDTPFDMLGREASEVEAGSEGLLMLPYFAGERTPLFDADARGVLAGMTLRHGRGHLYRALLEGAAYGVRHNLDVMTEAGAAPRRLVVVGGAAHDPLWRQIISDVTGYEQEIPEVLTGAAYGDALLAARAAGLASPDALWNRKAGLVSPGTPAARHIYDELYDVYRSLYSDSAEAVHALARLGR
jgi:xylulokinase